MANGEYEIDDETFLEWTAAKRDLMIFRQVNAQIKNCEKRFCKIENDHVALAKKFDRRKKVDTTFAGVMGFVGGVIGFLGSKLFK